MSGHIDREAACRQLGEFLAWARMNRISRLGDTGDAMDWVDSILSAALGVDEDDEPIEDIRIVWESGEKVKTRPPWSGADIAIKKFFADKAGCDEHCDATYQDCACDGL